MRQDAKGFVLIIGASSSIGAIYADRLAKPGHDLMGWRAVSTVCEGWPTSSSAKPPQGRGDRRRPGQAP
jgi:NAD(P)-dependent dehydrogenase (short-subunit alcohol dehydrogenase family)